MSREITKIERDTPRKARRDKGLTQSDVAAIIGVNQRLIFRMESEDIQV
ncbi:MAG TPA: helix-turn-helix domain-containing protein, partial [Dehalococcoidia bacterium]|nr:helix-turn-helix domain-containing protein [Dehalococcoidia bacterium]